MKDQKRKNPRRKKTVIVTAISIFVIVFGIVFLRKDFGEICYHLYWGDRLTCETELYIDGKAYPISTENVKAMQLLNGKENSVNSVKTTETGAVIRCKGGEYGSQPFLIEIQPDGMTGMLQIPVTVVVGNNWEITKMKLRIDADTTTEKLSYSGDFRMYHTSCFFDGEIDFDNDSGIRISGI